MRIRGQARFIAGAILLDLAVSPLFIWNVFTDPLSAELPISATRMSAVFSVGLAVFSVAVLLGGRMADAMAPRTLALGTATGMTTGLAITGVTPGFWGLLLGFGVVQGASAGLGYATAVRIASTATRYRGVSISLVVSAYAAGAAVLAPAVSYGLVTHGRAATLLVLAGALGIMLLVAAALVPDAAPPRKTVARRPSPQRGRGLVVAGLWLMFGLGSAPALAAYALAGDFTGGGAALAVSALNIGNLVGRLAAGPMAHIVGINVVLHGFAVAAVGACVVLAAFEAWWLAASALLILGVQYGALSVLTPLVTATAIPAHAFGRTYGVVFSAWGLVGLFAPVAATWVAAQTSSQIMVGGLIGVACAGWLAIGALLYWLRH